MPERQAAEVLIPPVMEWESLLKQNLGGRQARAVSQWLELSAFRTKLLEKATIFSGRLLAIARELKLWNTNLERYFSWIEASGLHGEQPVAMAGHQPIVYHPGLSFKNQTLNLVCGKLGMSGINVIVDTDEGDGGQIFFPVPFENTLKVGQLSLAHGPRLFLAQSVRPSHQVADVFAQIVDGLLRTKAEQAALQAKQAKELYCKLSGVAIAEANSLVRMFFERERRYLEVPFSEIASFPESQNFFQRLLLDFVRLWESYNQSLDHHRQEHKIKNPANPFPNLQRIGDKLEMPFWVVDRMGASRKTLWAEKKLLFTRSLS